MHGEQQSMRVSSQARKHDSRARGGGLFPCASPVWVTPDRPRSARRAARWRRRVAAKQMVGIIVGVSSWVSLGGPAKCPPDLQLPTSPAHILALDHLETSSLRWIRLIESSPDLVGSGRKGPAVARQFDALRDWMAAFPDACHGYAPVRGGLARMGAVTVKPLVPERMSLPSRGATFDLSAWLPEPIKSEFVHPRSIRKYDTPAAPRSRVYSKDWPGALRRMDQSNVLMLARASDVPRDGYGRIPRNGHFGLDKDKDWDRVICARVPSNSIEKPSKLAGSLLPHGCQVCDKILKPTVDWVFEKDDLKDFYPSCATSYEQALTTPIGPEVSASLLEGTSALDEARAREERGGQKSRQSGKWQPCLKSLPMGHLRAVEWAQLGHSNFLRAHGGLLDEEVLLYKASAPRASSWDGVMIDDRVTMREALCGTRLGESRQASTAAAAYLRFGLEASTTKRVRDAVEAEFWGAHVHGAEGWARVNDSGLQRPVGASLELCELGVVPGDLWRSVRGSWPNVLLYRRCGLGLTDQLFTFDPPGADIARIPSRVKEELLVLVALSPLFWTNLRAPVSTELGAADASDAWCAVVTSQVGERTASELWRLRDKRAGTYVRCETDLESMMRKGLNDGDAEEKLIVAAACAYSGTELPDLSEHERKYAWVSELADSLGWHEVTRYRVGFSEHINMKELRAYRTRLRHAARRAECHGTRQLTLLDSSVVRGATSKGRSSSRRLNRIWRPVIPELLAADIQDGTLPCPTKHNPADGGTRGERTRSESLIQPPPWLVALENGDYAPFDHVYAASTRVIPSVFFPDDPLASTEAGSTAPMSEFSTVLGVERSIDDDEDEDECPPLPLNGKFWSTPGRLLSRA